MTEKTRLSDIAEVAGVSTTTVARVLSGAGSNVRVSQARADSIRAIAVKMNYKPNIAARTLAGSSSRVIGVLIDSHAPGTQVRTLAEIERRAGKHGYRVMVGEIHDSYEGLAESYHVLRQYGVDGVIVMSRDYPEVPGGLDGHLESGSRMVFIDRPRLADANFVQIDREHGIKTAVRELKRLGRQRVALIVGRSNVLPIRQRVKGYQAAIGEASCLQAELIFRMAYSDTDASLVRDDVLRVVSEFIIPKSIDAVIIQNDLYALALLGELAKRGLNVPKDVAVIGQDNELFGECITPTLSTIDENATTAAAQAVRMLLDGLGDPEGAHIARQITVKPKLILRETV